jgi:hypothetical protein
MFEPDKPSEYQVVFQVFHQHPLTANRAGNLEQQRPAQLLRWSRAPTEPRRHVPKTLESSLNLIANLSDSAQGIADRNTLLSGDII